MSSMRRVNNFHKRLSFFCVVWAFAQLVFAYAFGGHRPWAYSTAIGCVVLTGIFWIALPAFGRRVTIKTISTRYYGTLRRLMMPSFLLTFIGPLIHYWFFKDKYQVAVITTLGFFAFFSFFLAYHVYGRSMYRFLARLPSVESTPTRL
jgi:hypothetical protein